MEHWDVYNKDRQKLNKTVTRGDRSYGNSNLKDGEFHLVVHICIFNSNNQMLIQKRHSNKITLSGLWDISAAGSAISNENSYMAAEREVKEELGLKVDLSKRRPHFTINFDKGFDDFYLLNKDIELNDLTLQESEVECVKWASEKEILELLELKKFVPYYKDIIKLLFAMKDRPLGSHSINI